MSRDKRKPDTKPRLLYLNGVWKIKLPDGTVRDATRAEVEEVLPRLAKQEVRRE